MYEAHFGLSQLPFRLAPDSSFYVDAAPHRAAIAAMQDQLRDGEAFVPLVGEFGVGKTTIARRLLEEVRGTRRRVGELPGVRIGGDDVFDRVGEALGLGQAAGDQVPRQLEELARGGRDALLLVDDAQRLEADALTRLRQLTELRFDGHAALQVLLVGRYLPAGVEALRLAGQSLAVGTPVRVEALDAAGTRAYVLERLDLAGWCGRPAFSPATTAEIHACCSGNPARINRLCGHVLLQLYMEGRDDLDPRIVRAVDQMLRSELDGEPAEARLPPPQSVAAPATSIELEFATDVAERGAEIIPTFTLPAPSHLPAPLRAAPGRAVIAMPMASRARSPSRHVLVQGVAAVALLVGGGWLWQTISNFTTARSMQARFAAAATAVPTPAATARTPAPATPPPAARPARDEVVALAEQAISRAPPGAGPPRAAAPAAPVATALAAAAVDPQRLADAAGRSHAHAAHKPRTHAAAVAAAAPVAANASCSLESEALGLCKQAKSHAAVRAAPAQPLVAARNPAPEPVVRPAPPAPTCDANRAALALCSEGSRAAP
jgi:type II secretory pathway predicted ATPase ExeA